jgi:hypothetical protein
LTPYFPAKRLFYDSTLRFKAQRDVETHVTVVSGHAVTYPEDVFSWAVRTAYLIQEFTVM